MIINERIREIESLDGYSLEKFNTYILDLLASYPQYSNIRFEVEYSYDYQVMYLRGDREETELEKEKREAHESREKALKEKARLSKIERDRATYNRLKKQFNDPS
jgi:hypothetical protein